MTSIAIGVVAHPTRKAQAEQLAHQVGADILFLDDCDLGSIANHRRTWHALTVISNTTHAVVLEDDALPVPHFRHQLQAAIENSPALITSLYLGRKRPPQWQAKIERALKHAHIHDAHYILATQLLHAVGVAMCTDHITAMLNHTTPLCARNLPWDEAIGAYARSIHETVAYTVPSLVDHADNGTLIAHRDRQPRTPGRVAWCTGIRHTWDRERTVTL